MQTTRPRLAFDPTFDAAQMQRWQQDVRSRLRELLAFPQIASTPQPPPTLQRETHRPGYVIQRWELYPEPGSAVPMDIMRPTIDAKPITKPLPAVMCYPGSEASLDQMTGEAAHTPTVDAAAANQTRRPHQRENQMALHMVKAGFVALVLENPATGIAADATMDNWRRYFGDLLWLGRTYEGISTFQKQQAYHWLRDQPWVDASRIATCGHSLGAKPAVLLGVLEPDIAAVVYNGPAISWQARSAATNLRPIGPWHYLPGLFQWFDYQDLMAAIAPRPLHVSEGGRREDIDHIKQAYRTAGGIDYANVGDMDAGDTDTGAFCLTYMHEFRDPASRVHDGEPLPNQNLSPADYDRLSHIDGGHFFKEDVVVPWLQSVLA